MPQGFHIVRAVFLVAKVVTIPPTAEDCNSRAVGDTEPSISFTTSYLATTPVYPSNSGWVPHYSLLPFDRP